MTNTWGQVPCECLQGALSKAYVLALFVANLRINNLPTLHSSNTAMASHECFASLQSFSCGNYVIGTNRIWC